MYEITRSVILYVHFGTYRSNNRQWHSDRTRRFATKKEASSCLYYSKTCIEVKCTHESTVVPAHTTNACRGGLEVHIEVSGQFHAPAVLFHGKET